MIGPGARRMVTVLSVVFVGGACSAQQRVEPQPPQHHRIEMRALLFSPDELHVRPGDTITWVNRDVVPHTARVEGATDSGELGAGESHTAVVTWEGRAEVTCEFHPVMKATLLSGER